MADSESAPLLDECTMVLGVSDHTMAMHQWMLLSAALRCRPEYAALLADPRLRPATVAKNPAAASYDYLNTLSVILSQTCYSRDTPARGTRGPHKVCDNLH